MLVVLVPWIIGAVDTPRCMNGPYIWSTLNDTNAGIGTALNFRRPSFALAELLDAQWVGTLRNAHDRFGNNELQDAAALLGIADPFCTTAELNRLYRLKRNSRRFVTYPFMASLCRTTPLHNLDRSSIVVVDTERGRGSMPPFWITCAFSYTFRSKLMMAAFSRGVQVKPADATWVGVHFRWGDTRAGTAETPARSALIRTGASLLTFANVTKRYRADRTFLFTENLDQTHLELFQKTVGRKVEVHTNSRRWADTLALMGQCTVLIGGSSSFFKLGARLCIFAGQPCTVVTTEPVEVTRHLGDEILVNVSSI